MRSRVDATLAELLVLADMGTDFGTVEDVSVLTFRYGRPIILVALSMTESNFASEQGRPQWPMAS